MKPFSIPNQTLYPNFKLKNFIIILTVLLALFFSSIIAKDNPPETLTTATSTELGEPAEPEHSGAVVAFIAIKIADKWS